MGKRLTALAVVALLGACGGDRGLPTGVPVVTRPDAGHPFDAGPPPFVPGCSDAGCDALHCGNFDGGPFAFYCGPVCGEPCSEPCASGACRLADGGAWVEASCTNAGGTEAWRPEPDCDDGDPCTVNDVCAGGTCAGVPKSCPSDACHAGTCDHASGQCVSTVVPNGSCDDGNACTTGDTCQSDGTCVGTAVSCPSDACHPGTCNPSTGQCNVNAGASCDDGNVCTHNDTCDSSGQCGGTPIHNDVDRFYNSGNNTYAWDSSWPYSGWTNQGHAFSSVPTGASGAKPLYILFDSNAIDRILSFSQSSGSYGSASQAATAFSSAVGGTSQLMVATFSTSWGTHHYFYLPGYGSPPSTGSGAGIWVCPP